jgi:nucleoside-diphosphate-sugar epimerase
MGGSSFVSQSLAVYLISKDYDVDILTRGSKRITYAGFKHHIICDRHSPQELKAELSKNCYDYIFDITAYNKNDVSILLESINTSQLKKYIFCSSGAVYKESDGLISETYERGDNPNWGSYGSDKKAAEDYIIGSTVPYAIFRPSYIYGENNNLYREGYFFDRIVSKKPIPLPCGGNARNQFIHIADLVRVFESAMFSDKGHGIYNVTRPEEIRWEELVLACGKAAGLAPIIKEIDINKITCNTREYFPFRDITYLLNPIHLKEDGLFVPEITLDVGLKRSFEWYQDEKPQLCDPRMSKVDEMCL